MVGRVNVDIFQSAALPLLLRLEAEGYELRAEAGVLRVRPMARVTHKLRAELALYKPDLIQLIRCCDPGVCARRNLMRGQFAASRPPRLPAFVFRPDVPYVKGTCFSCGEGLPEPRFGRCWRCSLAWRLAAGVPIDVDVAAALDTARVCA